MGNLLLIGNATIDDIMLLDHYPAEDEEMRAEGCYSLPGGNAANSAQILAELGHQVTLVASLGDDESAKRLHESLQHKGINMDFCPVFPNHQTPRSSIWINQQNGNRSITHYRDLPELPLTALQSLDIRKYDWMHLEGRNVEVISAYMASLDAQSKTRSSLEIEKARPGIEELTRHVDLCMLSNHYLWQTGHSARETMTNMKRFNPQLRISCTLGAQGLSALNEDGRQLELDAIPVQHVIDSRGAGDSFNAGLIDAVLRHQEYFKALQSAQRVAAEKLQHWGMTLHD